MRSLLVESGVQPDRIVCIANWVDTRQLQPLKHDNPFRAAHDLHDQFVVMYSGNLGLCQRLEDVVEAAELLRDRGDIRWLFVGDGANRGRLQAMARAKGLKNVRFLPFQPKGQLAASLSAADVHIVSIDPRVVKFLMPSKFYGVLASGTAVLSVAPPDCELARLTRDFGAGLVIAPGSPQALADAVSYACGHRGELAAMGTRGRQLAEAHYDRRQQTAAFGAMLSHLSGTPGMNVAAKPAPLGAANTAPGLLQESNP
jgi:colanic acid biosynthesis glycosyl transferase WcaI